MWILVETNLLSSNPGICSFWSNLPNSQSGSADMDEAGNACSSGSNGNMEAESDEDLDDSSMDLILLPLTDENCSELSGCTEGNNNNSEVNTETASQEKPRPQKSKPK